MATKFTNAIITKVNGEFFIEEFKVTKDAVESLGKHNLSEKLDGITDTEYIALSFTVKTELEADA